MRLLSVEYTEFEDSPQEWKLEGLTLGPINLLVGKNAAGKSRTLNIIGALARQFANERKPPLSGHYDVQFEHEGLQSRYVLKTENSLVQREQVWVNDVIRLDRGENGAGEIWAEQLEGGRMLRFQTPQDELAAVARRDAIQHTFLQPFREWGDSVRHYYFGSSLGKNRFAVFLDKGGGKIDEKANDVVVPLFKRAMKEFQEPFKEAVKADMARMDYPLNDITIAAPVTIRFENAPGELVGLSVQESASPGVTDQHSMSQGMFRALSLLIQVNYSQMAHRANCILIDDIGEGLDFERSRKLIELLRSKAQQSSFQLIMSTNDQFVMNHVPLDEWSMLKREGTQVRVYNKHNAREQFDYFRFVGMSNFTFFEMDFVNGPQKLEQAAAHE
jgi:energy-coupling factor transporter ATP-binding protein EcfA2